MGHLAEKQSFKFPKDNGKNNKIPNPMQEFAIDILYFSKTNRINAKDAPSLEHAQTGVTSLTCATYSSFFSCDKTFSGKSCREDR